MNFYILNKDDVIVSTLSTESIASEAAPLFKAELTEVLNGIHQLELVTVADSELTIEIKEDYTIIFKDEQGFKEFYIDEVVDEDSDYLPEKTVTASFSPIELKDELLLNNFDYNNASILLKSMLAGTRWQAGTVESGIYNRNFTEETENESVWTGINAIAKVFEADLYFHVSVSEKKVVQRYVSLYKQIGSDSGKRFEINKDITEIKRTVDITDIKTAIYPLGKEIEDEKGNKSRIDISSVEWKKSAGDPVDKPKGQLFISDNEAKLQWGRRNSDGSVRDRVIFMEMDFNSPESLASMAWVQLGRYRKPKVTYEAKVIDLYRLTEDEEFKHEQVFLGDTVSVIDRNFSNPIEITERVVEIKRDLLLPENTSVVIGNSKSSYSSDINRVDDIAKQISSVETSVNSVITSANGKNKTYHGSIEPDHSELAIGDSWVRPHPEKPKETQWLVWNGTNWDILLDTAENTEVQEKITEVETEVENNKKESEKALKDAEEARKQADEARKQAFNSEQLANSAKQDAILAIQKGDGNATEIKKLENGMQLTNSKVDGNTAQISSLKSTNEQLSSTIMKTQADLEGLNTGQINLIQDYPENEKQPININGYYWQYPFASRGSRIRVKPNTQYIIQWDYDYISGDDPNQMFTSIGFGNDDLDYAIDVPSGEGSMATSKKVIIIKTRDTTFHERYPYLAIRFSRTDTPRPSNMNYHSITVREGNTKGPWSPPLSAFAKQSEFSSFVQTSKGFQQTVNSDITGLRSQQTQMAGQISSIVTDVGEINTDTANYLIGTSMSENKRTRNWDYEIIRPLVPGDYIFQFKARASKQGSIMVYLNDDSGQNRTGVLYRNEANGSLTGNIPSFAINDGGFKDYFVKIRVVKAPNATNQIKMRVYGNSTDIEIVGKEAYLHRGWKEAVWQLPPESTATQSQITQLSNQIDLNVKQTETVDGRVTQQQGQINVLSNNISLKVDKDKVVTQINLSPENIRLNAKWIHLSGTSLIDSAVIKSAHIADAAITTAKIQNASITNAKILNLDVDKITGNKTEFVQSNWNSISNKVSIDSKGLSILDSNAQKSTDFFSSGITLYNKGRETAYLMGSFFMDKLGLDLGIKHGGHIRLMTGAAINNDIGGYLYGDVLIDVSDKVLTLGGPKDGVSYDHIVDIRNLRRITTGYNLDINSEETIKIGSSKSMELVAFNDDLILKSAESVYLSGNKEIRIGANDITAGDRIHLRVKRNYGNIISLEAVTGNSVHATIDFWNTGRVEINGNVVG